MKIKALRGFKDWLPEDFSCYAHLIDKAREVLSLYGFKEVKLPILEKTELFVRSIGEVTDIVQKETYTFEDRNGELVTLRPEATAGMCRMFVEHGLFNRPKPLKLFTVGPMFRHERPQKGRLREFYQISVEYFGRLTPLSEAELIFLAMQVLSAPGRVNTVLEVNSLGCAECRPVFREYLVRELGRLKGELCEVCQQRLERNPLRVLDCKKESCQEVVKRLKPISEFWCEECKKHFVSLLEGLRELSVSYKENPYLVRGLDYYQRTIFEIKVPGLGAQDTICAGGRYDGLVSQLGGLEINATGFAIGVERWALALFGEEKPAFLKPPVVFLALLGEKAALEGLKVAKALRETGLSTEATYEEKSLKAQLRDANRLGVRLVVILGEDELEKGVAVLKDMQTGEQEEVPLKEVVEKVRERCSA